jgi:hypothetical protein
LLFVGLSLVSACATPSEATPVCTVAPDPAAAPLDWLAGSWVLEDGNGTTEEHWQPWRGNAMLGCSQTYQGAATRFFEFLRLERQDGVLVFHAMPLGRPATPFRCVLEQPGVLVFENDHHDHPQRIRYERRGRDLVAVISQLDGSRQTVFAYRPK